MTRVRTDSERNARLRPPGFQRQIGIGVIPQCHYFQFSTCAPLPLVSSTTVLGTHMVSTNANGVSHSNVAASVEQCIMLCDWARPARGLMLDAQHDRNRLAVQAAVRCIQLPRHTNDGSNCQDERLGSALCSPECNSAKETPVVRSVRPIQRKW